MSEKILENLDAYDWYEALDRTSIGMEMVDRYTLFHPAIESNLALKQKVEIAHRPLFERYQEIASLTLNEANDK